MMITRLKTVKQQDIQKNIKTQDLIKNTTKAIK